MMPALKNTINRSRYGYFALLILLLAGCSSLGGQTPMSEAPGDVFSLEAANVNYPLANYLEILPDPTGQLTIEDVASEADSFQRWLRQALKRIGFAVLRAG